MTLRSVHLLFLRKVTSNNSFRSLKYDELFSKIEIPYSISIDHQRLLTKYDYFFFRLSASQEEKPLKFDDIVNKTTYDNMRPPKPEGNICSRFTIVF